ncbi:MFS transporter [Nocardia altamirensis]|uniref:MFS transporter n=1 Tax=Nocardia altamirensis TaxID=472158 RepID=UPI0008402C8E|nr:MFS transporter [Nocardia altamirensis]
MTFGAGGDAAVATVPTSSASRAALWSVRLTFFLTGALFATWAARIPTLKDELGLDDAGLAAAFAGLNIGAVLGLQAGKLVTLRFGSRTTLQVAMPLFAVSLSSLLLARSLLGLIVAVGAFAVLNSVVDIAMNAHGVAIEQVTGRPLLSGIHACHSLGVIGGSLVGAGAEYVGATLASHFVGVSVLVAAAGTIGARRLLPSSIDRRPTIGTQNGRPTHTWRWPARLIVLGALAFCVALAEGSANDWVAVYLRDETGADTTVAALGFALFAGAMFVGRLAGDRLVTRFGPVLPFAAGTMAAGLGLGAALLIGETIPALVGLVLFGAGISFTLPLTFAASGAVPGISTARAIANVSILGYLGFFTGPVLIGLVAHAHGLTAGLAVPVLIVLLAAMGAGALRPRR